MLKIELFNTLSRQLEPFEPLQPGVVRMYTCGPTVYDYAHIGNMRAFLCADLLQRVLRVVGGYEVRWVMNITDIDDKTIRGSTPGSPSWLPEMGEQTDDPHENLRRYTSFYEQAFLEDIERLRIRRSDLFAMPRATDYIAPMQDLVRRIVEHGFGYIAGGSVYFDLSAWRRVAQYGRLFTVDPEAIKPGARIDVDQYERDEVSDFVLWKGRKPGEPYWEFGLHGHSLPGRPGWHLECSVMEHELLGLPFDIHTGGIDLRFPHHENEIAQSMAGYGVDPTRFWVHNEFLEVEGQKMSKSLGNFYTLRDLLSRGIDPLDVRFAMLGAHYRSPFNFTFPGIEAARRARERVQEYIYALHDEPAAADGMTVNTAAVRESVFCHLANDLHTPKAFAEFFSFINATPPSALSAESRREVLHFLSEFNLIVDVWDIAPRPQEEIPEEIRRLAELRWQLRLQRRYAESDAIREQIQRAGYTIKDLRDGYVIERR
ncbi:MAG: cysteine--tRNA ligase [Candidatus Kapabacteria bacterium]|nr:cysteine--tRNA ligase [Candidatus Kapabacteria bacterium]MDW8012496.1 cysteine--tRNA ligase [Bacteroidota bacterium]